MKLIINSKELKLIKDKSVYNHNYYNHIKSVCDPKPEILEICHEDDNFYEYYLIEGDLKIFLGCSSKGIESDNILSIDFRLFYT